MPTKISTVIGGLRIALQTLADKLGVTLAIGGSDACTNGSVITLPDLPGDDETAALLARGYIDHETAHVRFTDFGVPVRAWLNLIEDVRIEREQGREFPGCAVNMRRLAAHLKGEGHFRGTPKNPLSLLMSWACCRGRSVVLGQPLGDLADQMEAVSRDLFGDLFCGAFASLVAEIGDCRSTADCDALARRIEDLIQNPPQPPSQATGGEGQGNPSGRDNQDEGTPDSSGSDPESNENGEDDQPGQEDSSDNEQDAGNGEEEKDPGEPGQHPANSGSDAGTVGGPSEPSPEGDDRTARTTGAGACPEAGSPPTEKQLQALRKAAAADPDQASKEVNVGELLKEALGIEHSQAAREGTLEVIPDTHHHAGATRAGGDQKLYERALGLDQARRLTAQMRARLAGLFQAVRLRHSSPKQVGHRIDREAVHRIACSTPDSRYFSSRRQRPDENTAVMILGDRSGSMKEDDKILVAIQAAFITAEALELLPGVACAVGFFPWGPQVAQLKDFGVKPKPSRFALDAYGGTPMAEALLWAGMKLTHRREPRRIIVVMTDGQPDDCQAARRAMQRLAQCGVETYGIGILDPSILQWMPEGARTIGRIEELPKALVDVLKEALVERRQAI